MGKPPYTLRARFQTIGKKELATLWLMECHGPKAGRECRLYGAMPQDAAEKVVAVFEAAGVKIERETGIDGELPHGTVEATIAATANQGELF